MRWVILLICLGQAAQADPIAAMSDAATKAFSRMPDVVIVPQIAGNCGATPAVDQRVAYCTTSNEILVSAAAQTLPELTYLLGHAFGHAVQVQHGVADIALRDIRNRPEDETMLRGLVERQVDCIAGFLTARAGLAPNDLTDFFVADPMTQPHWGRSPLRIGPVVDVPLSARADWFGIGQQGDIGACAPGEFTGRGLVRALRD